MAAYVYVPKQRKRKLDSKTKQTILVGYQEEFNNYRLYDPQTKRISISRDVTFNEETIVKATQKTGELSLKFDSNNEEEPEEINNEEEPEEINNEEEPEEIYNEEEPEETEEDEEVLIDLTEEANTADDTKNLQPVQEQKNLRDRKSIRKLSRYELNIAEYETPKSVKEAVYDPDATKWTEAICEELDSHEKNNTWTIVPRRTTDLRWVFKILKDTNSEVYCYKAQLCQRISTATRTRLH